MLLSVQPPPRKAQQPLRQKNDHNDEDEAERDQVGELVAEQARQELAGQLKEAGTDDRADQGADAADDIVDHGVAGGQKVDEIGRGEFVLHGVEHAGEACEQPGQHLRF
jgi:hypothetical protein